VLFAEEQARWILVLHTATAAAVVAVATHLVVWLRGFVRGRVGRLAGARKLALISAGLYVLTLILGNLVYPVYKVRVRMEYLEQPGAVLRDHQRRAEIARSAEAEHRALLGQAETATTPALTDTEIMERAAHLPRRTAKVARWFDVKEHWVALGAALAVGCAVILLAWDPRKHGMAIAPMVFLLALGAALAAWLGAIIGVTVSSYRAVGALGLILGFGGP
jgi:hypothetical protein